MDEIRLNVEIRGVISVTHVDALFDTGAQSNYLRRQLASGEDVDKVGICAYRGKREVKLADGTLVYGDAIAFPSMRFLRRRVVEPAFILLGDLKDEAVIGYRTMKALDLHLRPRIDRVWPHRD